MDPSLHKENKLIVIVKKSLKLKSIFGGQKLIVLQMIYWNGTVLEQRLNDCAAFNATLCSFE